MSNYSAIRALIDAHIKANGKQMITGPVMNSVLNGVINSIGGNYTFGGVVNPESNVGSPDANIFYLGSTAGVYTNLGGFELTDGIGVFTWDGAWRFQKLESVSASQILELISVALQPIEALIPPQASPENQLADKDFVNSSIATDTATFKGTFESVADLPSTDVKVNDYAFVITTDGSGDAEYSRYKYNGSAWVFEYTLNNSSFTAAQWAALNSGITAEKSQQVTQNTNAINEEIRAREQADTSILSQLAAAGVETINVTYSELVTMRDDSALVPGKSYRITDFETMVDSNYELAATSIKFISAGATTAFDIIVTATSSNTLSPVAKAAKREGSTYYDNNDLSAWELRYTLDNNRNIYRWANSSGKGVIYMLKDEFENCLPYDFKSIKGRNRDAYSSYTFTFFAYDSMSNIIDHSLTGYVHNVTWGPTTRYSTPNQELSFNFFMNSATSSVYNVNLGIGSFANNVSGTYGVYDVVGTMVESVNCKKLQESYLENIQYLECKELTRCYIKNSTISATGYNIKESFLMQMYAVSFTADVTQSVAIGLFSSCTFGGSFIALGVVRETNIVGFNNLLINATNVKTSRRVNNSVIMAQDVNLIATPAGGNLDNIYVDRSLSGIGDITFPERTNAFGTITASENSAGEIVFFNIADLAPTA